jgi:hypothetical protein
MSRTSNFAHQLVRSLRAKKTNFEWSIGTPPCKNRECVDVFGEGRKWLVLIEVELRRIAPAANIVKIWKWLDKDAQGPYAGKRLIVVQAFSSFYNGQKCFLSDNSKFLGRQMERRFRSSVKYIPIPFTYNPYGKRATVSVTHGGGAMLKAAEKLAHEIASTVRGY